MNQAEQVNAVINVRIADTTKPNGIPFHVKHDRVVRPEDLAEAIQEVIAVADHLMAEAARVVEAPEAVGKRQLFAWHNLWNTSLKTNRMKTLLLAFSFFSLVSLHAQTDTTQLGKTPTTKFVGKPVQKAERVPARLDGSSVTLYGDYTITGYSILSTKTPSNDELNTLIGTLVKFQETSITGTVIDPISFEIYQIERQRRDDYIFRVFGREIKAPEPDLPESFMVHKTDNENCYGIVVLDNGEIAFPYKGVLLYLKRN